jgi:MoaA/NifB/PqqE/SkfB family radical SAM enzyme
MGWVWRVLQTVLNRNGASKVVTPAGEHLLFCPDLARRDPSGRTFERIEGWCCGSAPISALYLQRSPQEYEQIPLGFSRPDVGRAFPNYPGTARAGFRFSPDREQPAGAISQLLVEITNTTGATERHRVSARFETRAVQTIALDEQTRLDSAPATGLGAPDDIEARFRRSLRKRPGLTLRLDIINKCNLRCVMCSFSDDAIFKRPTRQFSDEQFRALFDEIGPSVSQVMLSCGDEPLTSKYLPEILRYLAREHPQVSIGFCTNAMLMSAPLRELIMETRVARLLFSIDAVSKPLLEAIRVGCRYDQLVGNIIALRDLKASRRSSVPAFVFNFVMMNRNIHEAPAFVGMATALGAEAIDFRHVVPLFHDFPPEELLSAHQGKYNFYRHRIAAQARRFGVQYYLPPPFEKAEPWRPAQEADVDFGDFKRLVAHSPDGNPGHLPDRRQTPPGSSWEGTVAEDFSITFCNRPFSEMMIRDQEEVLPCPWYEKTLGRLSGGQSLSEIFLGDAFAGLRRNMLKPEGDPGCAHCPIKAGYLPIDSDA